MAAESSDSLPFRIDSRLDPGAFVSAFRGQGRLHVRSILEPGGAEALLHHLSREVAWSLVLNEGEQVREATPEMRRGFDPGGEAHLTQLAWAQASRGFQYLYECKRVPEDAAERRREPTLLHRFVDFLNSDPFIDFARRLTGISDIAWADAQATRYAPGHFLACHNDESAAGNRRVAYVYNLTPQWQSDWGGQLQFIDADGHIARAFVPRFNAMNLFAVPQLHAVSMVAPFAPAARYSVTGWLRAK